MEKIEILIKEYETLREEVLTTMQVRNSILSFGLATIGVILTAAIALVGNSALLSGLVLSAIVPSISIFILFMWLGEYQRMQRAGRFLVELEKKINEIAAGELLTWETSLRSQRRHMRYPYNTTVMMITIISVMSFSIGIIIMNLILLVSILLIVSGVLAHVVIYGYATSSMSKLRV